jgi:hypothetical protein
MAENNRKHAGWPAKQSVRGRDMKQHQTLQWKRYGERVGWVGVLLLAATLLALLAGFQAQAAEDEDDPAVRNATALVKEGREIFRYDTFGDERLWEGLFVFTRRSPVL